ncbi:hypothetical protein, partial [Aeromonas bestiarum]|uniref:hypothetical protein n=1 Tax=Aeromonas bestiarum TaxID=105751 RepID=UPI003D24ADC1
MKQEEMQNEKKPSLSTGLLVGGGAYGETDRVRLKHKEQQTGTELPVASRSPVCCSLFPYAVRQNQIAKRPSRWGRPFNLLAERTGLEPATPGVTGRYS